MITVFVVFVVRAHLILSAPTTLLDRRRPIDLAVVTRRLNSVNYDVPVHPLPVLHHDSPAVHDEVDAVLLHGPVVALPELAEGHLDGGAAVHARHAPDGDLVGGVGSYKDF